MPASAAPHINNPARTDLRRPPLARSAPQARSPGDRRQPAGAFEALLNDADAPARTPPPSKAATGAHIHGQGGRHTAVARQNAAPGQVDDTPPPAAALTVTAPEVADPPDITQSVVGVAIASPGTEAQAAPEAADPRQGPPDPLPAPHPAEQPAALLSLLPVNHGEGPLQPARPDAAQPEAALSIAAAGKPATAPRPSADAAPPPQGPPSGAEQPAAGTPQAAAAETPAASPALRHETGRPAAAVDAFAPSGLTQAPPDAPPLPPPAATPLIAPPKAAQAAPLPVQAIPLHDVPMTIAAMRQQDNHRFEIRLDPADLGRIDVTLDVGADGAIRAHLVVERPQTLQMLRQDAPALASALSDTGLKPESTTISFGLRGDGGGQQGAPDREQHPGRTSYRHRPEEPPVAVIRRPAFTPASGLDLTL